MTHAAFYGLGAYAVAFLLVGFGINFFLATLAGMILASGVAFAIGVVFLRLKEVYYVLGTVGSNVILFSVLLNWNSVTRGPLGIGGIPRPEIFGFRFSENEAFLLLVLAAVAITYAISVLITRSSFGRVLNAIREDEDVVSVFGYSVYHYKLVIFTIGAAFAALAGAFLASYLTYISPFSFTVVESIFILSIVVLGGLGSGRGALIAAGILVITPEALRFVGFTPDIAAQMRQVLYGLILILLMLYRPQGLLGRFRI
ncbi:hypothetical protein A3A39_01210 [Candidatus Kaiserbacteria bacterium RIFCSPLOWO2_01_FULL_54_13]|uniref:Branched-chain amino acid ABC transporter permease n=1 Tax=Candidatus Kaiserbacteria bacterium RIFCSPLOWO2_01_FULL_54_13 TaxID=1798512 RepID=A0A1F6F2B2_9BACT|nr:MAG: hypothetical protein A3A39_01210 [Candidatus Kaiserbacteria bacterium RIFCSPLOWO2_01_FULL_54_13]